jgi:hypothetical protein
MKSYGRIGPPLKNKNFNKRNTFLLIYETEVVILVEIGCPCYMVLYFSTHDNDKGQWPLEIWLRKPG